LPIPITTVSDVNQSCISLSTPFREVLTVYPQIPTTPAFVRA